METIEFEYCEKCGQSCPPSCIKEKGGFMLCPECYNEPMPFDEFDKFCDTVDLFEEMKNLNPHG